MTTRGTVLAAALVLSAFAVPEATAAVTHSGRISANNNPNGFVVIQTDVSITPLAIPVLKLKFRTPAGGEYKMKFCIGAASAPCGTGSYTITLGPQDERLALVDPGRFRNSVLFVFVDGQAVVDPIPFEVTIE